MLTIQDPTWNRLLKDEFDKEYYSLLEQYVNEQYSLYDCYPPKEQIFRAFELCPFDKVKVVILGQDPYHGPGQANGLCFSVQNGIKFPPSLLNIFKEIRNDIGQEIPLTGDLTHWAEQGVLMMNATLSVRHKEAGSHQKRGWETFTDAVIELLSKNKKDIVFILWGAYAQKKASLIDTNRHHILSSAHPSPLSAHAGFWNNNHFSRTNAYLLDIGEDAIEW